MCCSFTLNPSISKILDGIMATAQQVATAKTKLAEIKLTFHIGKPVTTLHHFQRYHTQLTSTSIFWISSDVHFCPTSVCAVSSCQECMSGLKWCNTLLTPNSLVAVDCKCRNAVFLRRHRYANTTTKVLSFTQCHECKLSCECLSSNCS